MADLKALKPITLEGRRIHFRNFSGAPTRFNTAGGIRDFIVFLEEQEAKAMEGDGWNIKYLKSRDEDEADAPILKIKVKFPSKDSRAQPPRVIMITSRGKTKLDEETIAVLDWADIENVDMIVRPYRWEVNGKEGISAYLNSIYITIREDDLERKYADTPDADGPPSSYQEPQEPF